MELLDLHNTHTHGFEKSRLKKVQGRGTKGVAGLTQYTHTHGFEKSQLKKKVQGRGTKGVAGLAQYTHTHGFEKSQLKKSTGEGNQGSCWTCTIHTYIKEPVTRNN